MHVGISNDRLIHSREVGRLAAQLGSEVFGWDEMRCQQMFLLGLVHDCGYEYVDDALDHPTVGSAILKEAGYSLWREVRWHGIPDAPYCSDELLLLNTADMLVNKDGKSVAFSQRLDDIKQRYGSDSQQFIQTERLIAELESAFKELGINFEYLLNSAIRISAD